MKTKLDVLRTDVQQNRKNKPLPSFLTFEEKGAILEFGELLRQKLGSRVREIILFGSRAKEEGERYSDIDILIVLNNVSWEIKKAISELAAYENLKYNVVISTIRYDIFTWENPVIKSSPFGVNVRKEGIWI